MLIAEHKIEDCGAGGRQNIKLRIVVHVDGRT